MAIFNETILDYAPTLHLKEGDAIKKTTYVKNLDVFFDQNLIMEK